MNPKNTKHATITKQRMDLQIFVIFVSFVLFVVRDSNGYFVRSWKAEV